jgi:hypothetical protein
MGLNRFKPISMRWLGTSAPTTGLFCTNALPVLPPMSSASTQWLTGTAPKALLAPPALCRSYWGPYVYVQTSLSKQLS